MKFYLDEDYAYPRWKLKDIQYKWKGKSLKPEIKEENLEEEPLELKEEIEEPEEK